MSEVKDGGLPVFPEEAELLEDDAGLGYDDELDELDELEALEALDREATGKALRRSMA